jgi:peroxiredoxin
VSCGHHIVADAKEKSLTVAASSIILYQLLQIVNRSSNSIVPAIQSFQQFNRSSNDEGESVMSLQRTAAEFKAKVQEMLGEKFSILTGDMERVRAAGTVDNALKVGQSAPDFTLPDAFGNQVSLKALLPKGPVVVSFYRGEWCPFCNIELRALAEALPKMRALGATLIAISPEKPDHGIVAAEKNNLAFPVLSDFGNKVARQFGIVFQVGQNLKEFSKDVFKNDIALRNGEESYELPVPATYVIDTAGIIHFAHVDVDYMLGRAEPEAVVAALETIASPIAG